MYICNTHIHIHTYKYACTYTHTYIHTPTHTPIHIYTDAPHTVGFHNFNLRILNLRVSNPNTLIVDVF